MRQTRFAFGLLILLGTALLLGTEPVAAHALLVRSDPAHDARLGEAPARVAAWFSEPLESSVSTLRVLDGAGNRIETGPVEIDRADPTKISVALREEPGPGFYTVTWETLSRVDGHIWFGSFDFTVLNPDGSLPSGSGPAAPPRVEGAPTGVLEGALTKFAGLIGAVLAVGSVAFALLVGLPATGVLEAPAAERARAATLRSLLWLAVPSLVLLAAVGAVELVLQARQLGGLGQIDTALGTTWGDRWWQRQLALAVLAGSVAGVAWARGRDARAGRVFLWLGLAAGAAYLVLVSAVSHAAAVPRGSFWATAADFAHLAAAAIWVGALIQLSMLLIWSRRVLSSDERPGLVAVALQRFSLLAGTSVVLLVATGVFSTFVQVSSLRALVETAYGRALIVKLALVLPLLAAGGVNAVILRPRLVRAAQAAGETERLRRLLVRMVVLEAALGVMVLGAVGALVQYPTARSLAGTLAGGLEPFAYPLVAGNWLAVAGGALGVVGALLWLWAGRWAGVGREARRTVQMAALGLPVLGALLVLVAVNPREPVPEVRVAVEQTLSDAAPSPVPPTSAGARPGAREGVAGPAVALRYQAAADRFVLLEIWPFQVGENTLRVTALGEQGRLVAADGATVRLSRLERAGDAAEVVATPATEGRGLLASVWLPEPGWWAFDVALAGGGAASFYLRLDQPSQAPLAFAPPDYEPDPAAAALFERAMARYQSQTSLRWREELTSGLLAPTGIGAWVLTSGEATAPSRVHLNVLSPGFSEYELYRVDGQSCRRERGGRWRCSTIEAEPVFDLDFQRGATAFRLGREEMLDGVPTQVLLFYNPTQPAWYAWWVEEGTGELHRQAMVAAGHFMLTRYFDHNAPVEIALPPGAR
ncbi:MAG: copper resistance CopC/CopD family protein [Dehalococcoidia bacterium]